MKAEVLVIGNEILNGSVLNTHCQYISRKLFEIGVETEFHTCIGDYVDDIRGAIELSLKRVELLIVTGGLGPTEDDLTKEVIADYLGLELIQDEAMVDIINSKLNSYKDIPKNNYKQAYKIKGSSFLNNEVGTAPGIFLEHNNFKICLLPGPPKELRPMFDNELLPLLGSKKGLYMKSIHIEGLGESYIEENIKYLINRYPELNVATFPHDNYVEVKLVGKASEEIVYNEFRDIVKELRLRFGENIFSYNGEGINKVLVDLLYEKSYKIGLAESCTGGLATNLIARISGASNVLEKSYIVYSNQAKIKDLGVNPETLDKYGAVSKETAYEMSLGLLKDKNLDMAIGITGIAGPGGDGTSKEKGLVYISIMDRNKYEVHEFHFKGDREYVQEKSAYKSLYLARKFVYNS